VKLRRVQLDLLEQFASLGMFSLLQCLHEILDQHSSMWGAEENNSIGGLEKAIQRIIILSLIKLGFDKRLKPSALPRTGKIEP
jgi:hypothetical protein